MHTAPGMGLCPTIFL